MKIKVFFVIATLCAAVFSLQAQQMPSSSAVYFKNGSVLYGQLQYDTLGTPNAVAIIGGSIFVFDQNEIDSIAYDVKPNPVLWPVRPLQVKQSGLAAAVTGGMLVGAGGTDSWGYRPTSGGLLHIAGRYYLHPAFSLGAAMGLDNYGGSFAYLSPMYVTISGMPWSGQIAPYYTLGYGYGITWGGSQESEWYRRSEKGGMYGMAAIGLRFFSRSRLHYTIQVGVQQQGRTVTEWYSWNDATQEIAVQHRRMQLSFGIGF